MAAAQNSPLKAPFPYFGGKSGAVEQVWQAFGNVQNCVEPFAGSAAMLLGAPEGTPATAPTVAAMMIAKKAMEDAMREACKMRPSGATLYSKKQLATIERFRAEMGGMYPSWWTENSAHEITDAAIRAVVEFKP